MPRSLRRLLAVLLGAVAFVVLVAGGLVVTGRAAYVVTHGVSMNPVYYQGDLVIVAKADSYHVGQIVAYRMPGKHLVVLHRIIGRNATGFVMKGDNNQSIDPTYPTPAQVVGRAMVHIPHGGRWFSDLTSPAVLALVGFAVVAAGGTTTAARRRRRRPVMASRTSTSTTPPPRGPGPVLPPALRTAAAITAGVAVLAVGLAALAFTSPLTTATSGHTQITRTMTFSYTAEVGRTAAYDGSTVYSPEPVFRRVTDSVDLHLAYQAPADRASTTSTIAVSAELSAASGWHTLIPLAAASSFTGGRNETTVRLDLSSLDTRAQAAAQATGMPTQPLTVTIVPTVSTGSGPAFTPKLALSLGPLQLSVANPASLTVNDSSPGAPGTRIPHTLTLLGKHVSVAGARSVSAIVLLLSLLAAAALAAFAVITRRALPSGEGAAIESRYPRLLARVEPLSTSTDLPVIDVADFATLAKLAENAGLLVLHWTDGDRETYVVLGDGTAYRYRTGDGRAAHPAPAAAIPAQQRNLPQAAPEPAAERPTNPRVD